MAEVQGAAGRDARRALLAACVYTLIMGVGMFVSYHVFGTAYGSPRLMETMWPVLGGLSLGTLLYVWRFASWRAVGFVRADWGQMLWLLPSALLILLMLLFLSRAILFGGLDVAAQRSIALIAGGTLLVGFAEELMFRGVVLGGFVRVMPRALAVLCSAVVFALLHSVNMLAGLSFMDMLFQLLASFIMGLFLALIYLRVRSIFPLMVVHWLWDFSVMSDEVVGHLPMVSACLLQYYALVLVMVVVLFVSLFRRGRAAGK